MSKSNTYKGLSYFGSYNPEIGYCLIVGDVSGEELEDLFELSTSGGTRSALDEILEFLKETPAINIDEIYFEEEVA